MVFCVSKRSLQVIAAVVVLIIVLLTAPLAAKTIVFTEYSTHDNAQLRRKQLEKFTEITGIEVDYQPLEWFDALEKYPVMVAAGTFPDLWMVPPDIWSSFEEFGDAFVDLRPYVERAGYNVDLLPEGQIEAGTVDGRWIGLSSYIGWIPGYQLLGYNEDYLQEAGLPEPGEDLTWDQLYDLDRRLTRDINGDGKADLLGSNIGQHTSSGHLGVTEQAMRAFGADWVKKDLSAAHVGNPTTMATFEFLKQFVDTYLESGVKPSWFSFRDAVSSMIMTGPQSMLAEYQGLQARGMSMGVTLCPKGPRHRGYIREPETERGPGVPVFPFLIPKGPNQEEAWKLFEFLVFDPRSLEVFAGMDVIPRVYYQPNLEGLIDKLGATAREMAYLLLQAQEEAVVELWNPLWGIKIDWGTNGIRGVMASYFMGEISLAQAVEDCERIINNALNEQQDRVKEIQSILRRAGLI